MYSNFTLSISAKPWLLAFGLFVIVSGQTFSQYAGYSAVADLPSFRKEFSSKSASVTSIQSSFTQEKVLTALTEKIASTGSFWFKRSNKVRIEYVKPFTYLVVINGDKILVRDEQNENRFNTKSNKMFQQVNRIMVDCVQGTILESKDFSTRVFENDRAYLMEMTPSEKTLRGLFQTIVLTVDKRDYSANTIEMNEPSGDKTTILFTDKKLNTQISDAVFAF
ncbi:MAG: outer membrane lipoprotein carrier protein LolA [Cyclobacteriaceae bacterium]|nr:outer membrane lipoprotein carrier protein LolA [Cyclobacteriaceae bacterium]MDH5249334.1 outer membrane lipoprotein carrier protein LolA [Cyclobacteriaceae bacterium]